jgi:HSP20 family protein
VANVERHAFGNLSGSSRNSPSPPDADEMKIDAEFKEGLLKVHLPKSEKAKPKTIDVKVF